METAKKSILKSIVDRFTFPKIGARNYIEEVLDPERGLTSGEIPAPEVPPSSGICTSYRDWFASRDDLSWARLTEAIRLKLRQPRPSENAEPAQELEPPSDGDYGAVEEAEALSKVKLATQMVFPAAVGWGGYFVIGQGALYNPAVASAVFGVHTLGILSMAFGWYVADKNIRVSKGMQMLGQAVCGACLLLTQVPASNKLK